MRSGPSSAASSTARAIREAARRGRVDLASICDHLAAHDAYAGVTVSDETFSVQPGTDAWAGFGR